MKTIIAAALLLAFAAPASAAKAKPQDFSDIRKWTALNEKCYYNGWTDEEALDAGEVCATADKLGKKLIARGYCLYGHGTVGKASGAHCYQTTNVPRPD